MSTYESLSHSKWDCKYHVVFVPKYRKKVLYGKIRQFFGPLFHDLASHRGCKILEGHMVQDHVHMLITIPPKYSVAEVIGYINLNSSVNRTAAARCWYFLCNFVDWRRVFC